MPRVRDGSYFPTLMAPHTLAERAMVALDTASLAAYAGIYGPPDEERHTLRLLGRGLEMESADTNPLATSVVRPPPAPAVPQRPARLASDEFCVLETAAR